jgi:hypothetical protein
MHPDGNKAMECTRKKILRRTGTKSKERRQDTPANHHYDKGTDKTTLVLHLIF